MSASRELPRKSPGFRENPGDHQRWRAGQRPVDARARLPGGDRACLPATPLQAPEISARISGKVLEALCARALFADHDATGAVRNGNSRTRCAWWRWRLSSSRGSATPWSPTSPPTRHFPKRSRPRIGCYIPPEAGFLAWLDCRRLANRLGSPNPARRQAHGDVS
jgi:hypothetical protein